ncbi:MAG TPA: gliding motility-associated C-terminal domain-containing protein [Flavobacteriales bacterium]|nr:gliding motility-associated C-terminal domain-containing protein [Flavobacteriales bacterium]
MFSPNGDGDNDFFKAFPYRFIEKIDLKIFNRWGQLLFLSEDPGFRWDGKSMENGKDVPEGVYFYTCTVYTIRLSGMEEIKLNGFIHLYRENGASSQ